MIPLEDDSLYDFTGSTCRGSISISRGSGQSIRSTISRLDSPHSQRLGRPASGTCQYSVASNSLRTFRDNGRSNMTRQEKEMHPRQVAKCLEDEIYALIDESARLKQDGKFLEALDKAKDSTKKEESLQKYRSDHSLPTEGQVELTFSVYFLLASCYECVDLPDEAIKAYMALTKQRDHHLAQRVRMNLGNIYYAQHDYPLAIKMYKMTLDAEVDMQILANIRCNIGNAFFRQGQLRDAVKNFEESMNAHPNHQAGFNLLVCHVALGDTDSAIDDFGRLIKIKLVSSFPPADSETDALSPVEDLNQNNATQTEGANHIVQLAARLIAPLMNAKELVEMLKDDHERLAMKMEYDFAVDLLKNNDRNRALRKLTTLEKKYPEAKAMIGTNLSLVHFLQGNIDTASDYAEVALNADRYNQQALINRGNCYFVNDEYEFAKELYLEAIGVEADCVQALFNLGLSNLRLNQPDEAIQAFEKLHTITPNNPVVIYHIADIYEGQGKLQDAIQWFNVLAASQSSDSTVLARLSYLYNKVEDESQSLHWNLESFRHLPTDLDVIAGIGAFFVQQEMFEKAIYFFQQAALVQPKEIKWSKSQSLEIVVHDHFALV